MKKLLPLLLLISGITQAEPIWSNQSSGGDDFLVGTVHLGDNRFNELSPRIKAAIDAVDVVVLEIDLAALSPQQQQQVTFKHGLLPYGQTLSDKLSIQVYKQAEKYLAGMGYDIKQFAQMKPWMLGLTMVQLAYVNQGLDVSKGVDQQIHNYALKQGKKIIGLETFEQQMRFFDQIIESAPELTNDDLILDTLNELNKYKHLPKQLMDAWLLGDMKAFENIYQLTLGQSQFDKAAEKILLTQRNQNWQQQLDPMLADKKVLVAVGTLHFVGSQRVLKLLKDKFVPQ